MRSMNRQVEIRQATTEDAVVVSNVLYQSFVEFEPLYSPQGFAATTPSAEKILMRMKEGPVWIVISGREILGSVAAVDKGTSLYIRGMAVLPSARGSGIGSLLLQHVQCWAAERSYTRVLLTTTPFLHAAIQLYEKHGFLRVESEPQDLFGTPLFTMEKNLQPTGSNVSEAFRKKGGH
jgi:GNAT superfamily N-acetyltransferase